MTTLESVREYAARGWSVVRVVTGQKHPPLSEPWAEFQSRRPTTSELTQWFSGPDAYTNFAIVLGPISGRTAVRDFDIGAAYDAWAEKYYEWARILPTVKTAKGCHVYFRLPADNHLSGIKVYDDGELRISGGICLLPPSKHPTGHIYQWIIPLPDGELPEIDPAEIGLVGNSKKPATPSAPLFPEIYTEGTRHNRLLSLAGALRRQNASKDAILAALSAENEARFRPPYPQKDIEEMACSIEHFDPAISQRSPVIVCIADVPPEEPQWLWHPFIPLGKLTIIDGNPGVGKTTLALQIAAIISRGWPFPNENGTLGIPRPHANVVYLTNEDGLADTISRRFRNADGETTRLFAVPGLRIQQGAKITDQIITLQDVDMLDQVLRTIQPAMIVIDPIQAYLGPKVDMHRANDVRPVLSGLAVLAERHRCAAVCIRHLAKAATGKALYQGLGSIDFVATARSVLMVAKDDQDPDRYVIAQTKNSLDEIGGSLTYQLKGGFAWTGTSCQSADDLVAVPISDKEETATENAAAFLAESLSQGPMSATTITAYARQRKISRSTLDRAKKRLSVLSTKTGPTWFWSIPAAIPHDMFPTIEA